MCEYLFRDWQVESEQEGRPVDTMEAHDIFTDDMKVSGPATSGLTTGCPWVTGGGDVANEGVKPDIDGLFGVTGDGDAPSQTGAGAGYR